MKTQTDSWLTSVDGPVRREIIASRLRKTNDPSILKFDRSYDTSAPTKVGMVDLRSSFPEKTYHKKEPTDNNLNHSSNFEATKQ